MNTTIVAHFVEDLKFTNEGVENKFTDIQANENEYQCIFYEIE